MLNQAKKWKFIEYNLNEETNRLKTLKKEKIL